MDIFDNNKNKNKPQKTKCSACSGRGKWQEMGEEKCMSCCGTGRTGGMVIAIPDDTTWCRNCNGRGRKPYCKTIYCSLCNGCGYVNF